MKPRLSIIIVNDGAEERLVECLRSLHIATSNALEIILVDMWPGHGAEKILSESGFGTMYLPQPRSVTFAQAANIGAHYAESDYICFVSPELLFGPQSLDRMFEWMMSHPREIVGPRVLDENGRPEITAKINLTRREILGAHWTLPSFRLRLRQLQAEQPMTVPTLWAGCLMMSRSTWRTVGEWHELVSSFGLESEWFERAQAAGFTATYLPTATVHHLGDHSHHHPGATARTLERDRRWHAGRKGWLTLLLLGALLAWRRWRDRQTPPT